MARSYAQFAAIVFLAVGTGGFLTGDASHVAQGQASGNFDGVALHLTYARDVIDLLLAGLFVYAGWFAEKRLGSLVCCASPSSGASSRMTMRAREASSRCTSHSP
jgi:hypothetical protein